MRLGGPVLEPLESPEAWVAALRRRVALFYLQTGLTVCILVTYTGRHGGL